MQERAVALIDMDCFYCQVEVRLNPSLKGKPVAVVQYNTWKGGGIIAVNYEARNLGVTRFMRGDDAQKHCPTLELAAVPEVRGRADLSKYRDASREVMAILCEFCACVEKASIDEAYLDLTDLVRNMNEKKVEPEGLQSTFVVGYNSDIEGTKQWLKDVFDGGINDTHACNLAQAALLVEQIRAVIFSRTGFHCSAGISHNKILSKLACGLFKPNRQTVLPPNSVPILFENLPLKKIRNLGGKFGTEVNEQLDIKTIGEVTKYSLSELQRRFGEKHGSWLYNIARGIDAEPVKPRIIAKSIGCCKNFKGYLALATKHDVKFWLAELCTELYERVQDDLITNNRKSTLMTISAQREVDNSCAFSRSTPLHSYNMEEMTRNCYALLRKFNKSSVDSLAWDPPLKFLGVSASKFVPVADASSSLLNFFKPKEVEEEANRSTASTSSSVACLSEPSTSSKMSEQPADGACCSKDTSVVGDDCDSFFCAYFGGATAAATAVDDVELADEASTEVSGASTAEPSVEDEANSIGEDMLAVMERCPDCDQLVAIVDIPEHADYHAARRLHEELNGVVASGSTTGAAAPATTGIAVPATTEAAAPATTSIAGPTHSTAVRSWTHSSASGRGKTKKVARTRSDPISKNRPITSFFQAKQRQH